MIINLLGSISCSYKAQGNSGTVVGLKKLISNCLTKMGQKFCLQQCFNIWR